LKGEKTKKTKKKEKVPKNFGEIKTFFVPRALLP
jgi:hypothetical protein